MTYWQQSRSPRYSLLFALPLLVAYEAMARVLSHGDTGIRNGADVILKSFFIWLGGRNGRDGRVGERHDEALGSRARSRGETGMDDVKDLSPRARVGVGRREARTPFRGRRRAGDISAEKGRN